MWNADETEHEVILASAGENRTAIMAALRKRLDLPLAEAKRLVDTPGARILSGPALQVLDVVEALRGLGATITVSPDLPEIPPWKRAPQRGSPRQQHYVFAHVALAQIFAREPHDLWSRLSSEAGTAMLQGLWRRIGAECPEKERAEEAGLSLSIETLGAREAAVITLPRPLAPAEAYMVALIRDPPRKKFLFTVRRESFRYVTLELGIDIMSGGGRTVLCEWLPDGSRANHGDGPEPTREAFVQALAALGEQSD
jgi:hypothetical protein